jgi:mono/diheme cytochrome c family protein
MNAISVPTNGYVPYYFADSDSGRLQAIAELVDNPFPITENGLARGKNLYNIFCAICHGENGNGLGYIYDTDKNPYAKYPAAPASFLRQEYLEASNGRYYNAIMYGYNVMGAYKDKISYEERWQVIHYIRKLQAAEKKVEYTPLINTLNASFGTPLADFDGGVGQVAGVNNVQGQQLTDNAEAGNAAGSQSLKKK